MKQAAVEHTGYFLNENTTTFLTTHKVAKIHQMQKKVADA